MEFLTSKKALYLFLVVISAAGVGYYVFNFSNTNRQESTSKNEATNSTSTVSTTINGVTIKGGGGVTVSVLPNVPIPSLDRAINPKGLTPEIAKLYSDRIKETSAVLKNDPKLFDSWILLGTLRKGIGDYEGASLAWEYASELAPTNIISFNNLGDLYHFYLKQYEKAETNFKLAIKNNHSTMSYQGLFDLYRYSYKTSTTLATDTLKEGIKKIPESIDLRVALAAYYKEKGNISQAKIYYEEALQKAKDQINTSFVGLIEEELKNI